MYIHSERFSLRTILTAVLVSVAVVVKAQVSVVTVVTPPYSSGFSQYAEKVKVTVISPVAGSLRLSMTITGDNGITIKTLETGTVAVPANQPFMVPEDYLYQFFDASSLNITGLSPSELSGKGFPAGSYQICFNATVTGAVSVVTGQSCSNRFTVTLARPPALLQPLCGSDQYRGGIQNILFSWAPATGAPGWTRYILRIVEIRDTLLSPAQALRSGTRPPFFEEEVSGTSYLYGPKDPPLEKGCRYAVEIIAIDEETNTRFANGGRSEMCWFKYGRDDAAIFELQEAPSLIASKNKSPEFKPQVKDPFPGTFFSPANVNGTLYYQYAGPALPSQVMMSVKPQTIDNPLLNSPDQSGQVDNKAVKRSFSYGGKSLTLNIVPATGKPAVVAGQYAKMNDDYLKNISFYNTDLRDPSKSFPLGNMPVSLVVKYMVYDVQSGKMRMLSGYEATSGNLQSTGYLTIKPDQVVATGYTDTDGYFDLTFFLKDSLGMIASNISFYTGSGEFKNHYKGNLFRVLRLVVGSPHYCSPAHDIIVQPGESSTYSDLYALVRTYGLTVKTKTEASPENYVDGPLEGLDVYILRKNKVADVPTDEGYPDWTAGAIPGMPAYTVVAHATTKQDGSATFMHLVKNLNGYDKYYVFVNSQSSQTLAYKSGIEEYSNTAPYNNPGYLNITENAVFNNEYEYKDTYLKSIDLYALPPQIYGQVALTSGTGKAADEGRLAEGSKVTLSAGWSLFSTVQGICTTDDEGKFSFVASAANGNITFSLRAEMEGYKTAYMALNNGVPLKKGQKVNAGTLFLATKAVFSGKIVDKDNGTGVRCHVSVQDGLSVYSTGPAMINTDLTAAADKLNQDDIGHINSSFGSLNLGSMKPVAVTFAPTDRSGRAVNTGQSGMRATKKQSLVISAINLNNGPSYFALPAPSGTQTIIFDPDDKVNYFSDTVVVSLAEGNNSGVIKMSRKIHRIKLVVRVAGTEEKDVFNPGFAGDNSRDAAQNTGGTASGASGNKGTNPLQGQSGKKNAGQQSGQQNTSAGKRANQMESPDLKDRIDNQNFYIVTNAQVRVVGRTDYVLTDDKGVAYLEFDGSDNFEIEVIPPKERDLEAATRTFTGFVATKDYVEQELSLKVAASVSGIVTFNGQGVPGARVKLNYPGKDVETLTGDDGSYILHNVPVGESIDIEASKDKYVGAIVTLSLTPDGKQDVGLELTQSAEMDYSMMLGFPIAVTREEKAGDRIYIDGSFISLPRNGQLETQEEGQELTFTNLEVKKGTALGESGLPYPVPVEASVKTNENEAPVLFNSTFTGRIESDKKGIEVIKGATDNSGFVKGKVSLNTDISFQTNAVSFGSERIYVRSSSSDQAPVPFNVIASDGTKPFTDNLIPLFSQDGKNINYQLFGFNAEAVAGVSVIDGTKVKLNTVLHTNLQNTGTADLAVKLGDVELTTQSVMPLSGTTAITMPLEQWTLKAQKWTLNSSGFKLKEGEVITHMANVPFTDMEIEPQALKYGTFELQKMNIRGLTNLNVTGNASLIYQGGHWNLAVVPTGSSCGYLDPLPGMPSGAKINVTSVYLKSNKTGSFAVDTEPFKLYGLVDYNPTSLAVYDDRIEFPGTVNLNIPDVPDRSALIKYKKSGSEVRLFFQPFSFTFSTKGVDLAFSLDENSLSPSGFTAKGTLSEPGLYSVNVQLNKNSYGTEIIDMPGQSFPIDKSGNRRLDNFDGEMHVVSDQWTNFVFSGDLAGASGVSGRLTFTINGEITADNQSVQVDKIPTPFGDLKLTYDFDKGRLIGLLEIEQDLAGTGYIKGSAESVVDAQGWYFCAGGKLTMKGNPYIKNASTAMLFGDYPALNDPFITQTFADYSYTHALPTAFQSYISGFYIDGAAEFPVPYVPDIDIDLVVVSGHASVSAGGNFSLGMNFADDGNTYYTGSSVFVNASIGVGGSIGIACAGASFSANVEIAQQGELKSNGDWFLEGTSTITLTGSAYAGAGCCDSDCDGYYVCPCVDDHWSGAVALQLLAHMGSDDNYFKIQW